MKEIKKVNSVHTFKLKLSGIPEGFLVDLIETKEKTYEVWLYNVNCVRSNNNLSKRMFIDTIPGIRDGKMLTIKDLSSIAEKRLLNSRFCFDEIEEYTEVFLDQKIYDKYFGMKIA